MLESSIRGKIIPFLLIHFRGGKSFPYHPLIKHIVKEWVTWLSDTVRVVLRPITSVENCFLLISCEIKGKTYSEIYR